MTTLWICEKYSAAAELTRTLFGGIASHSPPLITAKDGTHLAYTNGHALQPAAPEIYDPAYKSWDHQDLPDLVEKGFRWVVSLGKSSIVATIEKEIKSATAIVVATDAGREGEMIAWELIEQVGTTAPVKRFWTSALTEGALRKAAAALLPADHKLPLFHAARARARADWVEGLTYTRYFTRQHGAPHSQPLSVGRVQSAVTALVEDRCREIRDFVSKAYFEVEATVETPHGPLRLHHRPPADRRIENREEAEGIARQIIGQTASLSVKTTPKTTKPLDFMSTSGAQKRAFGLWGWSPEITLEQLQSLYEAKFITYPRTECIYLSSDHAMQMPHLLARLAALPEVAKVAEAHPEWIEKPVIRPASYDDTRLTDHHAIIPTDHIPDLAQLKPDEAKLYQLVVRHCVANLLPDFAYDSTAITAQFEGRPFVARGQTITELGWRTILADHGAEEDVKRARKRRKAEPAGPDAGIGDSTDDIEEEGRTDLPSVADGERVTVQEGAVAAKDTKAPPYFTQASLLDAMVNIDLYIDDPRAKTVLGGPSADQKRGIGTGATRAHIIKTIFDRGYVEEKDKALRTTSRGSAFIALARRLIPWMVDPLHSVEQEAALLDIEAGQGSEDSYVSDVLQRTRQTLATLQSGNDTTRIEDIPGASLHRQGHGRSRSTPGKRPAATDPRAYFAVPYEQREQAKTAGLRWDADVRKWYASPETADQIGRENGFDLAPASGTASRNPIPAGNPEDRVYYRVPFDRKDQAKTIGMRFDGERKQWFAPSAEIATAANEMFPANK
jgi:DNA topoisomerase-3